MYWHGDIGRRKTGARVSSRKGKRKVELGSVQTNTKIGTEKRKVVSRKSGNIKVRVFQAEFANVIDSKAKTTKKVKILNVIGNDANLHYIRRQIITKGAVVETEAGKAKITSRPSQDGVVNAIKIE